MTNKVQSEYFSQYNMPHRCVVCGSTETTGKIPARGASWNNKQQLAVEFPICAECDELAQTSQKRGRRIIILAVLGGLVGCITGTILSVNPDTGRANFLVGILAGAVIYVLVNRGFWFAFATRGMTHEQKARVKLLDKAVKITEFRMPGLLSGKGQVTFQFDNLVFASEFATLNHGTLK